MPRPPVRVAAIHDISCYGRCSLNVILPVLSSLGLTACPVPSAVLSTHTGGYGEVAISDLTGFLSDCLNHWKTLNLKIAAIYSGFLASHQQIDKVQEYIDAYPDAFVLVDPVMGDNGSAYRTCTRELQTKMRNLIKSANLITPNLTEAAMLLGEPYPGGEISVSTAKEWLERLSNEGPEMVVITGMALLPDKLSGICFNRKTNEFWRVDNTRVPINLPGTGDIYAATLLGKLLTKSSLKESLSWAGYFIEQCIKYTFSHGTDIREGILLEAVLPTLYSKQINISPTKL